MRVQENAQAFENQNKQLLLSNIIPILESVLVRICLTKSRTQKTKERIRTKSGLETTFWDHTKNYLEDYRSKEKAYIIDRLKTHNLHTLLMHYYTKKTPTVLIRKIIKESIKKEALNKKNRKMVKFKYFYLLGLAYIGKCKTKNEL